MRKKPVLAALVSLVVAACGRTEAPAVQAQCAADADCTTLCDGYKHATCSVGGICACGDPIPVASQKCESSSSCSCPEGYGSPLCGADGLCYCNLVQVVEFGCRTSDIVCNCGDVEGICAQDGLCYCNQTIPAPTECPAITRQEFVQRLYMAMGLECAKTSCTDLAGLSVSEYQAKCMWGALENAGIIASSAQCGPDKKMTRSEVAKMVITAIDGLADYTAPATPTFTDVPTDAWYYDFIESAVQLGLSMGYLDASGNSTGLFGPGDPASTCWVGELIRNALSPNKTLNVSLDPGTPNSAVVAKGASGIKLATYCFSADNVPLRSLIITRGGVGLVADWQAIHFVDEGGSQVTNSYALISDQGKDYAIFMFGVTVSGSRCFTLVGDLSSSAVTGNQHFFYISSKWDVLADGYAVTGDFPVAGNTFTVGNVSAPTLTVSRASIPVSGSYVKGQDGVPALGISLTAGPQGLTLSKLAVRLYSNTANTWVSALGDQFAIADIESATLYAGVDVVGGPTAPTLVDTGANGYTPGADWYKVQFDYLGLSIPANTTMVFTLKLKLLNSMSSVTYVAADLMPSEDIVAEDSSGNAVTASGSALNGTVDHDPLITVLVSGGLVASCELTPEGGIVVAGTTMHLASKYRFNAQEEGYTVNKLTVINDVTGPFDTPSDTVAVSQVVIRYPDVNGVTQTRTGSLSNGSATFSGLCFYAPAGQSAYVEIYANVSNLVDVGETLSGMTFRLGILDTGNTVSTFEAVGAMSSATTNDPFIPNGAGVNSFMVRKSTLILQKDPMLSTTLINGVNRLYGFGACADDSGAVSFVGFTYEFVANSATLSDFHVYRNSVQLTPAQATITVVGSHVLVAFLQEETIGAGQCQTYHLDGTASGVVMSSSVATKLVIGTGAPLSLTNPFANPNTGWVYGFGGTSIFVNPQGLVSEDYDYLSFIWSDRSADAHAYPVITNGLVTAGSGSHDWTNGWGLGADLPSHTLTP